MKCSEGRRSMIQRMERWIVTTVLLYLLLAYRITPALWRHYEHNPALADEPKTTTTPEYIPGDPINIGLAGTQPEIIQAFLAAGWSPADPITWRTSFAIAGSVLFGRADRTAPWRSCRGHRWAGGPDRRLRRRAAE
jgi:LssY C-terminus